MSSTDPILNIQIFDSFNPKQTRDIQITRQPTPNTKTTTNQFRNYRKKNAETVRTRGSLPSLKEATGTMWAREGGEDFAHHSNTNRARPQAECHSKVGFEKQLTATRTISQNSYQVFVIETSRIQKTIPHQQTEKEANFFWKIFQPRFSFEFFWSKQKGAKEYQNQSFQLSILNSQKKICNPQNSNLKQNLL